MNFPNNLKVLQLPSWYLPEGGQFCEQQSLFLRARGVEVSILANVVLPWRKYKWKIFTYPFRPFWVTEKEIPVFRNYMFRIPTQDKPNVDRWISQTIKMVDQYIAQFGKPDLIHVHSSMWGGVVAAKIKEKHQIPYLITEHRGILSTQSATQFDESVFWKKEYIEKSFTFANKIIPVSAFQIPKIIKLGGCKEQIRVISNVVDTSFFSYQERTRGEFFTFVNVNSYVWLKGYDLLLNAFDLLCETEPTARLVIAGAGFQSPIFQKQLAALTHKDKIEFTGRLSPLGVKELLHRCDAFVLSSRVEAQPISVLEAASTGLPIVCTEVVPNEVVNAQIGIRVPINDVEKLHNGMKQLMQNQEQYNGKWISNHIHSMASPEHVIDSLLETYSEVLKQN